MAPVVIAATTASAVVGAAGAVSAAKAAEATGVANQQGFNRAADVIDQNKEIVDAKLKNNLYILNRNNAARDALTTVNYLKSGVTLDGTPEELLAENARLAQYEANVLEYNSKLEKKRLDDEAAQMRYRGEVAMMTGKNLATSYRYKAYGSLLSGGSSTAASYQKYYG
jgi:isopentenyl diphosphate isomerase/L-lactate dehydrogenase-like FMN-dependent dehydrogenase